MIGGRRHKDRDQVPRVSGLVHAVSPRSRNRIPWITGARLVRAADNGGFFGFYAAIGSLLARIAGMPNRRFLVRPDVGANDPDARDRQLVPRDAPRVYSSAARPGSNWGRGVSKPDRVAAGDAALAAGSTAGGFAWPVGGPPSGK